LRLKLPRAVLVQNFHPLFRRLSSRIPMDAIQKKQRSNRRVYGTNPVNIFVFFSLKAQHSVSPKLFGQRQFAWIALARFELLKIFVNPIDYVIHYLTESLFGSTLVFKLHAEDGRLKNSLNDV
jgi:hypothetical protein